jgi:hypothetical protein
MMTAVQGIVAAGTAAYLTRNSSWENVALTANHLFYLAGIACLESSTEIPYFSFAAKAVFMLTPVFLMEHFRQGQVNSENSESFSYFFNRFYYAAAVVSTVVLVALGHTSYGVGFFAVMALDMASRTSNVYEYVQKAFALGAGTTAMLTFASYAVKLTTPRGQYLMGLIAAQMFLPRIWKIVQNSFSGSGSSSSGSKSAGFRGSSHQTRTAPIGDNPWGDQRAMGLSHYAVVPVGFLSPQPLTVPASGLVVGVLKSFTGSLPHSL